MVEEVVAAGPEDPDAAYVHPTARRCLNSCRSTATGRIDAVLEIGWARRIFRACRELGVRSVAIYSEVDRTAPWARLADESYQLDGVTARETYLNQEAIFAAAAAAGADAIHPGYGFLSENPDLRRPASSAASTSLAPAQKRCWRWAAKQWRARSPIERCAGHPWVDGAGATMRSYRRRRRAIGYPVLIKASAGGGGKGMRVVWQAEEFRDALHQARNESMSSFGSDHILVEKYFTEVRHIEVQILGDQHGNIVHLFERECSVQRRHQKIIEETPSPIVTPELREAMCGAALRLAAAVGYVSAGTVEFMVTPAGVLLPGDEYAAPGRASDHGSGDRHRPGQLADPA
jgi:3-methylcrotonyl-CoA carboxylase alpha subunit